MERCWAGWFLVQEDLDTFSATGTTSVRGAQKVWLVDPRGSRHLVVQWSADHAPEALLVAWSPDGRHALFAGNDQLADVDLVNDTVEGFAVPNIVGAGYTPSGTNIVALADDPTTDPNERAAVLRRFGSDGVIESVLASDVSMLGYSVPRWLYSHDGAMVYLPGGGGLRTVSNAGGQARQFDIIEPPAELCSPVRWWDPHTILVSCDEPPGPRMWLAPSNGGTATALSAPAGIDRATSGTDWGSFDAVRTASGQIFAQRPSTCGSVDIASLDARGHAHQLTIPGSLGTDWLTGSAGERIAVRSTTSDDCRGRGWFGFYNPTTHTTQRVIDDPTDQVGAVAAIPATTSSYPPSMPRAIRRSDQRPESQHVGQRRVQFHSARHERGPKRQLAAGDQNEVVAGQGQPDLSRRSFVCSDVVENSVVQVTAKHDVEVGDRGAHRAIESLGTLVSWPGKPCRQLADRHPAVVRTCHGVPLARADWCRPAR